MFDTGFCLVFSLCVLGASLGAFSISKFHIFQPSKTTDKQQLFKQFTKYYCKNILYLQCSSSIKCYI